MRAVTVITAVAREDGWVVDALGGAPGHAGVHYRYVTRPRDCGSPGCGDHGDHGDGDSGDSTAAVDVEAPPPPAAGTPPLAADADPAASAPPPVAAAGAAAGATATAGRPPLGALLAAAVAAAPSHTTVGVAFCGPRQMEVALRAAAAAAAAGSRRPPRGRGGEAAGECPPCGRDIRFLVRAERF